MKTIVLTAEHEHEGRVCAPGCELTLTDDDADRLVDLGKATVATTYPARAPAPKAIESTHDKEQQA